MKLHQLLAILPKIKADSTKAKTNLYHCIQKTPELFKGLSRTYAPREDNGFVYPPESKQIQVHSVQVLEQFKEACTELFNTAAMQDYANAEARADVVIQGTTILANVPVAYLLFLEKQLIDVRTFIQAMPVLDTDQSWTYDNNRSVYVTEGKQSVKTKKTTKPVVLYEATKEHPAQVKEASEDIVEGTWTTIQFSGALSQADANRFLANTDQLIKAVITAREQANQIEVQPKSFAGVIFGYLFSS